MSARDLSRITFARAVADRQAERVPQTCPACHGRGQVYDPLCKRRRPCHTCGGLGFVSVRKHTEDIPT